MTNKHIDFSRQYYTLRKRLSDKSADNTRGHYDLCQQVG